MDTQPQTSVAAAVDADAASEATYHGSRSASHIGRKPAFGQTCSMKTLLQDGILQAGEKVLTLEYEGRKFYGDLRRDGTIMMRDPDDAPHIYATPVAWANHCCKMLNPESKPLNAWSSIRFKGKRLDSYKLKWYRAQKSNKNNNDNDSPSVNLSMNQQQNNVLMIHNQIATYENPLKNKKLIKSLLINYNMDNDCKRLVAKSLDLSTNPAAYTNSVVISYEQLGTRGPHNTHNPNTMVKCIPFSAVDRIQPFNVTVSTNALLLIDFHSHLVHGEVAGYLAGYWDPGQHVLVISQAFPCKTNLEDEQTATRVDEEIRQDIEKRNLTLVGWYHSHQGKYSNYPTIRDIQTQMEYQITMKESPGGYTPCVGLICSPHDTRTEDDLSPSFQIFWVMPPPEHLGNHYGRPMQMYYSVTRDLFLTQDLLLEMRLLANYYTGNSADMIDFRSTYEHNNKVTNLEKLSGSIKPKLPKDLQESEYPEEPNIWKAAIDHFWKFLKNLVIPPDEGELKSADDPPEESKSQMEDESIEKSIQNEDNQIEEAEKDEEISEGQE
uniref:MPN domain-containing protein n=1 Tax=Aceria tosichella TaxID=561515 RepID=A0A6G1SNZ7_9ACAR